jgi:Tol biopolymer transport system component
VVRPSPALAFDDPIGRMYVVDPNGRNLRRVGRLRDVSHPAWSPDGRRVAYDGFDLGIFAKRLGSREQARQVAPTQFSGENGFVSSFDPAWRPLLLEH